MKGLDLIKHFEGCKLRAYPDQGGRITIGWGSTGPDIQLGLEWSQELADERLMKDVTECQARIMQLVKVPINANQLWALTSFTYNLGIGNLKRSGLLRLLNLRHYKEAAEQFLLWNKIGHYVSNGLTKRREAERALFLSPPTNESHV